MTRAIISWLAVVTYVKIWDVSLASRHRFNLPDHSPWSLSRASAAGPSARVPIRSPGRRSAASDADSS